MTGKTATPKLYGMDPEKLPKEALESYLRTGDIGTIPLGALLEASVYTDFREMVRKRTIVIYDPKAPETSARLACVFRVDWTHGPDAVYQVDGIDYYIGGRTGILVKLLRTPDRKRAPSFKHVVAVAATDPYLAYMNSRAKKPAI
ncbi:MAG TPA: hypothetical protein VLA77_03200 [Candidatus Saccharimonadales bacterium]|nr:hypothetical protein [Candidatus Saccharimonadales bacterium]